MRVLDKSRPLYHLRDSRHARPHRAAVLAGHCEARTAWSSARGRLAVARPPPCTAPWVLSAAPELNVMTIEDPVEYTFPSINQIQINEQAGRGHSPPVSGRSCGRSPT